MKDTALEVGQSVPEEMPLAAAIAAIVRLRTLSLPVRRGDEIVGLLRLADLYAMVEKMVLNGDDESLGRE